MAAASAEDGGGMYPTKPPSDVVLPPKDIRNVLEKSAAFVVRRGEAYEERMLPMAKTEAKMQFVLPDNVYHSFYQWRKKEITAGRGVGDEDGAGLAAQAKKGRKGPEEPPPFEFSARMPTISAVDLEIVRLTALFVAVRGSAWMTRFSQTYGQQAQFQFLRPQHSFHQYFNRMIDQYRELLLADGGELLQRQKRRREALDHNIKDKYHMLDRAKQRAEWVKYRETQKEQKEAQDEADKLAYAQIDWHDFAVVGTIEFTEADEQVDLPEPQSLNDLQSQSLEQKAGLSAPVGMRLEEAMPEHAEFFTGSQVPQQQQQQQPPPPPQPTFSPAPPPAGMPYPPTTPYTQTPPPALPYLPPQAASSEEALFIAQRQAESERAAAVRAAATGPTGPMQIRDNYIPRAAQARRAASAANTVVCPICKESVAAEEYAAHVRIEQLDPAWREQTRIAQQRSMTTNLSTVDVANNLKRLASQRSDLFDPLTGREIDPSAAREAKRQEVHYGVASLPDGAQAQAQSQGQRPTDVQEQLRLLQSKYGQGGGGQ